MFSLTVNSFRKWSGMEFISFWVNLIDPFAPTLCVVVFLSSFAVMAFSRSSVMLSDAALRIRRVTSSRSFSSGTYLMASKILCNSRSVKYPYSGRQCLFSGCPYRSEYDVLFPLHFLLIDFFLANFIFR